MVHAGMTAPPPIKRQQKNTSAMGGSQEQGTQTNPVAFSTNPKTFVKLGIVDHANHDDAHEDQG